MQHARPDGAAGRGEGHAALDSRRLHGASTDTGVARSSSERAIECGPGGDSRLESRGSGEGETMMETKDYCTL